MDTINTVRMFCDGQMSVHDVRALVLSMGHSESDFVSAIGTLLAEDGAAMRISRYQKEEYQADLYLTAVR